MPGLMGSGTGTILGNRRMRMRGTVLQAKASQDRLRRQNSAGQDKRYGSNSLHLRIDYTLSGLRLCAQRPFGPDSALLGIRLLPPQEQQQRRPQHKQRH